MVMNPAEANRKAIPFDEYVRQWHATWAPTFSRSYEGVARRLIDKHLVPHFGSIDLREIKRAAAESGTGIRPYYRETISGFAMRPRRPEQAQATTATVLKLLLDRLVPRFQLRGTRCRNFSVRSTTTKSGVARTRVCRGNFQRYFTRASRPSSE